ncbi:phytanoyl-CoA dioxygenase family protein [Glonium stellatum]|uniref:Phytanoyl-CoA dioxygenase family protein n=1 Tax=Glonium stellatum TaxID=574774 RepID=A0A8E2ESK1_9PEZI|nr:phytanoyl-CoA dioxygenase family protein [Glonium stellatum]
MPAAKMPLSFQELVIVPLSDQERDSQTISPENVGKAVSAMHRDGIVVLENAVNPDHIDKLNSVLSPEAEVMAKLPTTHFNSIEDEGDLPCGNMTQGPPLDPELMFSDIWANGPAAAILNTLLGPKPCVNFANGNTALGGFVGGRQRVHADISFNHCAFPTLIVTNYYLVDASPANGSTELWLGSHRDGTFADQRNCRDTPPPRGETEFGIRKELVAARRLFAPPIQPTVKRGSVILRDLRLWHAGRSNPSPDPRIMLAFVHSPAWYKCPSTVQMPETARPLVEHLLRPFLGLVECSADWPLSTFR